MSHQSTGPTGPAQLNLDLPDCSSGKIVFYDRQVHQGQPAVTQSNNTLPTQMKHWLKKKHVEREKLLPVGGEGKISSEG